MSALREAVLTGLNGCLHASLAVLRAAFEMLLLDSWWRMKRHDEQTYRTFYGWFDGSSTAPGAGRLLPDCYEERPATAPTESEAREIYGRLCSYVHKPSFREAITTIRRSARTKDTDEALRPWLGVVESTLRVLLDLQVRAAPRCLFPVEITRKFGFNPPVGMFFDASNSVPLEIALGSHVITEYRAYYGKDGVPSEVQWAYEHPDLTDDQIVATWSDADSLPQGKSLTETIRLGEMLMKAKIRGMSHLLAYDAEPPVMPDFNKMLHDMGLDG